METWLVVLFLSLAGSAGDELKRETASMSSSVTVIQSEQPVYRRFKRNMPRRHDRGAFARLGVGVAGMTGDGRGGAKGITPTGQLALGWLPWKQVAIHATAFGFGSDKDGGVGLGPGVTFWFKEEGSVYLSATAGPVVGLGHRYADVEQRQWMLGGEVELGLHWWVGDQWSLGGSVFAGGEAVELDGDGESQARARGGLRIGVTFN